MPMPLGLCGRKDHFLQKAAIGFGIEDADNVVAARLEIFLAMIGEPEAAMRVEHHVVRAAQNAAEIAGL
jgi:hypothetical protein